MRQLREAVLRRMRRFGVSGGELEALRDYAPGDDSREIDWRATARLGIVQMRTRTRELTLTWGAIVDRSSSMRAGRQRELLECAREAAATWRSCCTPGDRWFDFAQPATAFCLAAALSSAGARLRTPAALLVASDFHDLAHVENGLLQRLARRVQCTALIARDPWYDGLPLRGFVRVVDMENGRVQALFVGSREAERYREAVAVREEAVARRLRHNGWRCAILEEGGGTIALLRAFDLA